MEKICSGCGFTKKIVNSFFKLCLTCNSARLSNNKPEKVKEHVKNISTLKKGSFTTCITKSKVKKQKSEFTSRGSGFKKESMIVLDERFYEKCFNMSDHFCEECNTELNNVFRDDRGKVANRARYSHIIAKSIAPELRHNTDNINHLCLECHGEWENGDREKMKIYSYNVKRLPNYF